MYFKLQIEFKHLLNFNVSMCPRPDIPEYFRKLLFMQTHVLANNLLCPHMPT